MLWKPAVAMLMIPPESPAIATDVPCTVAPVPEKLNAWLELPPMLTTPGVPTGPPAMLPETPTTLPIA
jgi:hypothetical protein